MTPNAGKIGIGKTTVARIALVFALAGLLAAAFLPAVARAEIDNRTVAPAPVDWKSPLLTDHPLVGKIWSAASSGFVTAQELGTKLALTRYILLGEIHDNPDHHLWQAWAIRTISKLRGARIVEGAPQADFIAMEMLNVDQYPGIDKFYGRDAEVPRVRKPRAFGRMVDWKNSGWPDFEIYEPIIAQAMHEQLALVPASPSRTSNRSVSTQGLEKALSEAERQRMALDNDLPGPLQTALIDEIREGHCNMMPDKHLPRMAEVQRYRDATMADALLSSGDHKGAILIAGNGHIRSDRAVPYFLRARGIASSQIATVAIVEVSEKETDAAAYLPTAPDNTAAADFVIFTPRLDRPDPCERMKQQFEAMRAARAAKTEKPSPDPPESAGHSPPPADAHTDKSPVNSPVDPPAKP